MKRIKLLKAQYRNSKNNTKVAQNNTAVAVATEGTYTQNIRKLNYETMPINWLFPVTFRAGYSANFNRSYVDYPAVPNAWFNYVSDIRSLIAYSGVGSGSVKMLSKRVTYGYAGSYKITATIYALVEASASATIFTIPVSFTSPVESNDEYNAMNF